MSQYGEISRTFDGQQTTIVVGYSSTARRLVNLLVGKRRDFSVRVTSGDVWHITIEGEWGPPERPAE